MKKFVIAGYYGFGNMGDEAILAAILQEIRSWYEEFSVVVVSGDPANTLNCHRTKAIAWSDVSGIASAIRDCDLVILGGGGLFQDYWGFDAGAILTADHIGIPFYSSIALFSSIYQKKLMLYAVGVGPLFSAEGKSHVRAIAELADAITVRDQASKCQLVELGIPPSRVSVTADPCFRLRFHFDGKRPPTVSRNTDPLLGVCLRNWDVDVSPRIWETETAAALDAFLESYPNGRVVFIHFQDQAGVLLNDYGTARRVREKMKHSRRASILKRSSNIWDRARALSDCDLILGMRLHSLVLAAMFGIPMVGVVYDPKVKILLEQLRLEGYGLDLLRLTAGSLAALLNDAYQKRDNLAASMRKACSALSARAAGNIQRVDRLLAVEGKAWTRTSSSAQQMLKSTALKTALELEKKSKCVEELRGNVISLEGNLQDLRADIDAREIRFHKILQETEAQLIQTTALAVNLERELSIKRSAICSLENQAISLGQTVCSLQEHIRSDQETIATLEVRSTAAEHNIASLERQICTDRRSYLTLQAGHRRVRLEISRLTANISINEDRISTLTAAAQSAGEKIAELENLADRRKEEIVHLDGELGAIKSSRGWKFLFGLWRIRLMLFPHGSSREKIIRVVVRFPRKVSGDLQNLARAAARRLRDRSSRYAYAFHLYRQNRKRLVKTDLTPLRTPCESGLVSIVLPVFNGAEYLPEALESILHQTYRQFELIVVNDGSTDGTRQILDAYARLDHRIQVIDQENQKLPRSLNNGFQLARGEFLTWTSHDNRLKPDFLEKMVACLNRHPAWDMVYANLDIIGEDGKSLRGSPWFAGYQAPFGSEHIHLPTRTGELNTYANNFIGGAFLYRSRVKALVGDFNPTQYTREDYDYWMRVNSLMTLKHADFAQPVYEYRFHSRSLTSKDEELRITSDRKFLMAFEDYRRDLNLTPLTIIIDGDFRGSPGARKDAVLRWLRAAGHKLIDRKQLEGLSLPKLWAPLVYLHFSVDPGCWPPLPEKLPAGTIKALLCLSDGPLPENPAQGWDICMDWGKPTFLPRLNDHHLGWWASEDPKTLLSAIDIAARSRQASLLEQEGTRENPTGPKISVIVCTYQRPQGLASALRALARQSLPQENFEILVVDNDPDPSALPPVIERLRAELFAPCPDRLRLLYCPTLGLSYARNAGISEARGEILVFLDDDAVAGETLLAEYLAAYSNHPEAGVIGGHILLERPVTLAIPWKPDWERYWSHFVTGYTQYTPVDRWWEYPWGANWSARRKALLQTGGFRSIYGRTGNDFRGGEEIVAASQINSLGYSVAILPQAQVVHQVDPTRFTRNHLKQTILAGHLSHYQAQLELRLPVESNLAGSIQQINNGLARIFRLILALNSPETRAVMMETRYHISAHLYLFRQQVFDGLMRLFL